MILTLHDVIMGRELMIPMVLFLLGLIIPQT